MKSAFQGDLSNFDPGAEFDRVLDFLFDGARAISTGHGQIVRNSQDEGWLRRRYVDAQELANRRGEAA